MSGKYFLETFGCQMNILDSELVEGQLRARGMSATTDYREAELILFNTCSVRQHAEDKVLSRIGQLKSLKRRRPETIVGVIGCMAEREKEGLFAKAPHVDLLCGPGELNRLTSLIDDVRSRNDRAAALAGSLSRRTEVLQRALETDSLEALDLSRAAALRDSDTLQSYIRVQRGCDKFCTFCVVPFTRGPERSRPPEHIVQEARMLAGRGCREVTLIGQTVNSYVHQDAGRPVRFAELLERVHEVEGLDRIRFVTSFPADWDDDIFRVLRDLPRIMPYLHIPAQSGSDAVLARMKRGYTIAEYRRILDAARRHVPNIAIAGDVIVGFCGETDDDFAATLRLVREVRYSGLFVFKYSPRPGTKADRNLDDDVPDEVKSRRCNELLAVQAGIALEQKQQLVGRSVEVLVEGLSRLSRKALLGEANAQLRARGKSSAALSADGRSTSARPQPIQESEQDRGAEVARPHHVAMAAFGRDSSSSADPTVSPAALRQLVGRTPQDTIVVFDAPAEQIGAIVRVRIDSATPNTLFGRVVETLSPARSNAARPTNTGSRALPVLAAAE